MEKAINGGLTDVSDEQLEAIAGGVILDMGDDYEGEDRFVLIDDKSGKAVMYADSLEPCIVRANGGPAGTGPSGSGRTFDTTVITPEEYKARFGREF